MENDILNYTEVKIPVPWGHISGKWWGSEEKQPILTVHGWQDNAGSFDLLIPLLPKTHSYLCIDLPGHGLSSHLPQGNPYYIMSDGVLCIRRVLKHYGWKNVSLMGHSLGAAVCFIYAATYPTETNMVISIDSIQPALTADEISFGSGTAIDKFLEYDSLPKESLPQYDYDEAVSILKQQYKISEEGCNALLKRGLEKTPNGKYIFSRDARLQVINIGGMSTAIAANLAKQVKCNYVNIKFVPGHDFDPFHIHQAILNIVQKNAKQFKLIRIKGNHHVHLSEPQHVANVVSKFISQL